MLVNTRCDTKNLNLLKPHLSKQLSPVLLRLLKHLRKHVLSTWCKRCSKPKLSWTQKLQRSVWRSAEGLRRGSVGSCSAKHSQQLAAHQCSAAFACRLKRQRLATLLQRCKTLSNATVALEKLARRRHAVVTLRGIVHMVQAPLQCAASVVEKMMQNFAHQSVPPTKYNEKCSSFRVLSALKIRVSMVRFRPRPPNIHRSLAKGYGVFVCASPSASAVQ